MVRNYCHIPILSYLVLLSSFALAQSPDTLWTKTFGIGGNTGHSVQQTTDGGYIITGYNHTNNSDVWLIKTDASGNTLWTNTFGGINEDRSRSVQQTTDGGYIIAGHTLSYGAGSYDFWLIKTDASGDTLWTNTFGGIYEDYGYSVQQTSDGGYIVTGYTFSDGASLYDVLLIKTDAAGDAVWTKTLGGSNSEYAYSVQQTSDGGYILTGVITPSAVLLIKTDAAGNTAWTKTFGGGSWDYGQSVRQTSDGGYIITGYSNSYGAGADDVWLIKTNAAGNEVWNKTFGGSNDERGNSVQQTSDGGYIIAGYTESYGAGSYDVWLIKTDASGDTLWTKTFGGIDEDGSHSVQQTSDGGYIITGYTDSYGGVWLLRLGTGTALEQDSLALVALYNSTDGANWTNTWDLNTAVDSWYGVTVSSGRVTALSLAINNLNGAIPPELGNLVNLTGLSLGDNSLGGTIPAELGNLANLQSISLDLNHLSGSIPAEIGNLTNLTNLGLYSNQFDGAIPPELGNLVNLTYMNISSNQLTGSLPAELGNLANVTYFDLSNNQLSGTIPTELGNRTNLTHILLEGNQLTGPVPASLGNLVNLQQLILSNNQLTGSIPTELGNLVNLRRLHLDFNQITGLPDLGSLTALDYLQVENNHLTFEDLEPNVGVASTAYSYAPQDSVGVALDTVVSIGSNLTLLLAVGGTANLYTWKKDGVIIDPLSSANNYGFYPISYADAGTYTCEVTSTIVTDLTLYSRPMNVTIPLIVSTYPTQNALNVPLDSPISVTFGVDMNPATINASTFVVHGSQTGKHGGTYSYNASTYTTTFTPSSPFKVGEQVSVTVTTGVQSNPGDYLLEPLVWNFFSTVLGGSGNFNPKIDYASGYKPHSVIAAYLDGDTNLDLATTNVDNSVSVLLGNGDGTFTTKVDYDDIGHIPTSLIAADFDGDGDQDLAFSNAGSNYITILEARGDGSFEISANYGVGTRSWSIVTADLDGNGVLDLAVANRDSNTVSVLKGNGDGTFAPMEEYSAGSSPYSVIAAELNGDSNLDLAVTNSSNNSVSVLFGNGDGTFAPEVTYGVSGSHSISLAAADLDGDGDLDLVVANSASSTVSVLTGYNNGIFIETMSYSVGGEPYHVLAADLDDDGDMDLATTNWDSSSVSILKGKGDGTFFASFDNIVGDTPYGICAADLDGDGDLDLSVANWESSTISVLLNRGTAADIALSTGSLSFGSTIIGTTDTLILTVYNHGVDSTLQVSSITSSNAVFAISPSSFSVLLSDSATVTITFLPDDMMTYSDSLTIHSNDPQNPETKVYLSGIGNPIISTYPAQNALNVPTYSDISITFGVDIDPATINANTFVVHGSYTGKISGVYSYDAGTRTATFSPNQPFRIGETVYVILTGGINSVSAEALSPSYNWEFGVKTNGGSLEFTQLNDYWDTNLYTTLAVGDWDVDGDLDLAASIDTGYGNILTLQNDGSAAFTLIPPFNESDRNEWQSVVVSGDWDSDGDLDLAVANYNECLNILSRDDTGLFTLVETYCWGSYTPTTAVGVGDWDGDGDLDLAVTTESPPEISFLVNNGAGIFIKVSSRELGHIPTCIAAGDYDNDGDTDLALSVIDTLLVLYSDGLAHFSQGGEYLIGLNTFAITTGDWDGDGFLDLAAAIGDNDYVAILINDQSGKFSSIYNQYIYRPSSLTVGDMDGDGDLDIIASACTSSVLVNDGTGSFVHWPFGPMREHDINNISVGDWDGDGDLDVAITNLDSNYISIWINSNVFSAWLELDVGVEYSDTVNIFYQVWNPNNNPTSLLCEYSIDDGNSWEFPTLIGDTTDLSPNNYTGTLFWDSYTDLPGQDLADMRLRITPYDQTGQGRAYATPTFHLDNNREPSAILTPVAEGEHRGDITIGYQLSDAENDTLSVQCEYLAPNSAVWHPATVTGDTSGITSSVYAGSLIWNSAPDQPEGIGYYYFRIIPYDNDPGVMDTVTIMIDQLGVPIAIAISQFDTEQSGDIEIAYTFADDENDTLSIVGDYSEDSGQNWALASIEGKTTSLLPVEYSGSFIWQSGIDLGGVDKTTIRFRITPHDANPGFAIETQDFHLDNNDPPTVVAGAINDTIISRVSIPYTLTDTEGDSLTLSAAYSQDQGSTWQQGHLVYNQDRLGPDDYTGTIDWLAFADLHGEHSDVNLRLIPHDNDPGIGDTLTGLTVIYHPGDYTGDLLISTGDLAEFAAAWNSEPQDLAYEIGPTTGIVPELIPQPDGVLDFEDLTVFAMMWNWSFAHNGFAKSIPVLAKAITENITIRLIQRIPEDLYRWDGTILVDLFVDGTENLMMVDGIVSYASGSLQLMEVKDGGYLRQFFEATPLFTQVSDDSSQALFALAGLGTVEPGKVDDLPVATFRFKPKAHESQPLVLDYTLIGIDGGPVEAGQVQFEVENLIPMEYALHQNFPNPFNPSTTIRFELPKDTDVYLVIYDILGREVTRLKQEQLGAGYHQVLWNGRDRAGRDLASGIYFARLVTLEYSKTMKMLLLK